MFPVTIVNRQGSEKISGNGRCSTAGTGWFLCSPWRSLLFCGSPTLLYDWCRRQTIRSVKLRLRSGFRILGSLPPFHLTYLWLFAWAQKSPSSFVLAGDMKHSTHWLIVWYR
jgi:hypothetical protein